MQFLCTFEYKLMLYITYANRRMEGGFVTNDSWICGEWKVDLWRMTAGFVRSKGASFIGILPCKQHLLAYKPRLNSPPPLNQCFAHTNQLTIT